MSTASTNPGTTAARYAHGPEIAEHLTVWLEQMRADLVAGAVICGAWTGPHDCTRALGHRGDHWCGGWDAWAAPTPGASRPSTGCGDVWNQDPYDADDCDDSFFLAQRDADHPTDQRCCADDPRVPS